MFYIKYTYSHLRMLGHVRDHPLDGQAEEHPLAPQGWLPLDPEGPLLAHLAISFHPTHLIYSA
jgi:hypothetical protein